MFKRDCQTCIPDLQLTADDQKHTIHPDKSDTYNFDVQLTNIGEDLAYSVVLEFKLPPTLALNNLKIEGEMVTVLVIQSKFISKRECADIFPYFTHPRIPYFNFLDRLLNES